jgi:hypothetical protein
MKSLERRVASLEAPLSDNTHEARLELIDRLRRGEDVDLSQYAPVDPKQLEALR